MASVLDSLNASLHQAMGSDDRVLLIGQDILDPYGGAFKVSRGLSENYPDRVITTPISEAGMVGLASGLALRGLLPIVEIMFGDFVTLIADQVINHAAKLRWMYNDTVRVPIVIRTPMGGRRGYGPTHSQTLEKIYLGIPGIQILAPCAFGDPGNLLLSAIFDCMDPVLFVENKLLYLQQIHSEENFSEFQIKEISSVELSRDHGDVPLNENKLKHSTFILTIRDAPSAAITLAAYGFMAEIACKAVLELAYEHEIFVELIIPTQLAPCDFTLFRDSIKKTGNLIVIEEGTRRSGWGAELVAELKEISGNNLRYAGRVAALDSPIPVSKHLEEAMLPGTSQIVRAAIDILNNPKKSGKYEE